MPIGRDEGDAGAGETLHPTIDADWQMPSSQIPDSQDASLQQLPPLLIGHRPEGLGPN